jgi:hypothetical protein
MFRRLGYSGLLTNRKVHYSTSKRVLPCQATSLMPHYPTSQNSVWILCSHPLVTIPCDLFTRGMPTKICQAFLPSFYYFILYSFASTFLSLFLPFTDAIFLIYFILFASLCSRDSAVDIATGYMVGDRGVGVRVPVGSRIFSSVRRPDRLWGPPGSYPMRTGGGGAFAGGKAAGACNWPLTSN